MLFHHAYLYLNKHGCSSASLVEELKISCATHLLQVARNDLQLLTIWKNLRSAQNDGD